MKNIIELLDEWFEEDEECNRKSGIMDPSYVMMVVPKTKTAKKIINLYKGEKIKKTKLNLGETKTSTYNINWLVNILKFLKTKTNHHVHITIGNNTPMCIENDELKVYISHRE